MEKARLTRETKKAKKKARGERSSAVFAAHRAKNKTAAAAAAAVGPSPAPQAPAPSDPVGLGGGFEEGAASPPFPGVEFVTAVLEGALWAGPESADAKAAAASGDTPSGRRRKRAA
ncbi:hypothetical protein TeGR_g3662 [Tetraparma gracilis]|uniref:Uncharacterized protein n=1 Tax=Tetraparma gracilis TaxID=2962635 RepID=A0ABQ6MLP8_9STRA|nr:hypothetical protein TeGR_g3662 [Tetraparma gracilis]